jgi:hypothetical protein
VDPERGQHPVLVEGGELEVVHPHHARVEAVAKESCDRAGSAVSRGARHRGCLHELRIGVQQVARQQVRKVRGGGVVNLVGPTDQVQVHRRHAFSISQLSGDPW